MTIRLKPLDTKNVGQIFCQIPAVAAFDYIDPDTITRCVRRETLTSLTQFTALRPVFGKSLGCVLIQFFGAFSLLIQSLNFSSEFGRLFQKSPILVWIRNACLGQLFGYFFKFSRRGLH